MATSNRSWSERIKDISLRLTGQIPVVGSLIGFVLNELWPSASPSLPDPIDIWNCIKDEVQNLVDEAVLNRELDERRGDLQGLKWNLEQFERCPHGSEKGKWLIYILGSCNDLRGHFTQSRNKVHFIHLTITLANLHLGILRQRLLHGDKMGLESNKYLWDEELTNMVQYYIDFLSDLKGQWIEWRKDQIKIEYISPDKIVRDTKSDRKVWFTYKPHILNSMLEEVRYRMVRENIGELMPTYKMAFGLRRYFPGKN